MAGAVALGHKVERARGLGLHGGQPASYNHYRVEPRDGGWQLTIESRDYRHDGGEFVAGESRLLHLLRDKV